MKKGLLFAVIIVVLATCVLALNETKLIPRQTNFLGDNVHILLIKDLAAHLEHQVGVLDAKLEQMDAKLAELEAIKSDFDKPVEVSTTGLATQFNDINSDMREIKQSVNELQRLREDLQELQEPEIVEKDYTVIYIIGFLAVNTILLIVMIYTYATRKPKHRPIKTMHEYIAHCLEENVDEHEIKHELLKKGWSTKEINQAFKEVK